MFWSIRTKFLSAFLAGVMVTLIITFWVSYASFETVYESINEHSTNAEFYQISSEIEMLLSEAETLLASRITYSNEAELISKSHRYSVAEISYAINELSREVVSITGNFRYVDSVYAYVEEEWLLAMSNLNTRRFYELDKIGLSQRVLDLLAEAETFGKVAGYVTDKDFPLEMSEPAYLMLYKKAYYAGKENFYCMNIKESALFEKYAGYIKDGIRVIRILDDEGMIVSSEDKAEIGTKFQMLEAENMSKAGMVNVNGVMTSFRPIEGYELVIVSSVPESVYTSDLVLLRNRLLLVIGLGMTILAVFFYFWIEKKLVPIQSIGIGMKAAGRGDYSQKLMVNGIDELSELTRNYNIMLTDLEELMENRKLIEVELRERELAALRNEINPHFLYNTLNTIKCMADLAGNEDIVRCIVALGGVIAPLYKVNSPTWTLREETKLLRKYLEIMNIRYGNGIILSEDIPDELLEQQVMKFILQPIVENSIMHGFADRAYTGSIILTAKVLEDNLYLTIDDDGMGMTVAEMDRFNASLKSGNETGGVGMMNVSRRIMLRYGVGYGLFLTHSKLGGLCSHIVLPA